MSFSSGRKLVTSGHAWLGDIPSDWQLKRAGALFQQRREKCSDKEFPPLSVTKKGIVPQLDTAAKTDDGDNRKKVLKGDFVINSRSDRKGSSGLSRLPGSVSLINTVLIPKGLDGYFTHHLLRCEAFQEEYYRWGKGIVADLWSTNFFEFRSIVMPVPALYEQRQIAAYLNRETAKIDRLIAKQQRLIELLQEKRQAVISQAVTKGLDLNVKMKDSGINWLGEVPETWGIQKLSRMTSKIGSGKTPKGGADQYKSEGILFLRSQNVYDYGLRLEEAVYIDEEMDLELAFSRVKPGDILLNITGGSIGRTCLVPQDFGHANVNQHVCLIRLASESLISRELLSWFLKSSNVKNAIDFVQNGAAREGLNFEQIASFVVPVPPKSEQSLICKHIEINVLAFDALLNKIEKAINLLREHRQALISAAVTGKIDVRDLVSEEEVAALDAEPAEILTLDTEEDASYATEEEQG